MLDWAQEAIDRGGWEEFERERTRRARAALCSAVGLDGLRCRRKHVEGDELCARHYRMVLTLRAWLRGGLDRDRALLEHGLLELEPWPGPRPRGAFPTRPLEASAE